MIFKGFILIAEDDDLQRLLMMHSLRQVGLLQSQFHILNDAGQVIHYLAQVDGGAQSPPKPDLIITDMRMPGMNGLELAEQVRRTHPTLPVIILTAAIAPGQVEQ